MNEENILIQAGLSEEQALAYQSLLDKGPQRASDLAKWTGIKRGLIYKVLEQLESMGLISKKGGPGTVATFSPSHPSLLLTNLERKEKEIALNKEILVSSIGTLSSKYNLIIGKPNVQFFEGEAGILKVAHDSLSSKTEICSFVDSEAVIQIYPEFNKDYVSKRLKNNIKKRIISNDSPALREALKNDDKNLTEQRIVKQKIHFSNIVMIYDNKISYITLDPKRAIGIIIEDPDIYKTNQALFDYIWETAEQA